MDVNGVGVRPGIHFVGTLTRAYRRAVRDGLTVVGSAQVLRHGAVVVPELRQIPLPHARFWRHPHPPDDVAPSVPPSRWSPDFDEQVALFAKGALREAAYDGGPGAAEFSPLVQHAVYQAVHEASRRDGVPAGVRHLLAALFAEPDSGSSAVARKLVGQRGHVLNREAPEYRAGGPPSAWASGGLVAARVLPGTAPRGLDLPWRTVATTVTYFLLRRPFRRHGAHYGHPIPFLIEVQAARQAVRFGRTHTGTAEVLLCIIDLHEQLQAAGAVLPHPVARHNTAGQVLREHGVTGHAAVVAESRLPAVPHSAPGVVPAKGWRDPRTRLRPPRLDPGAAFALRSASGSARAAGDPFAGTTHLLAAILTDRDGQATRLLRTLGADPEAIVAALPTR